MKKRVEKKTAVKTVKLPPIKKVEEVREKIVVLTTLPKKKEELTTAIIKEKIEVLTKVPLPNGHVRVEVQIPFQGMIDKLEPGDIVDLPERRFKSLSNRGIIRQYFGEKQPNKKR